eukprot:UN0573
MMDLGFLPGAGAATIPAIAKLFLANAIGPLTVWPEQVPRNQFHAEVLQSVSCKRLCRNPGDLVYIFPYTNGKTSKSSIAQYGSQKAAGALDAGGPFMCKDSVDLPEEVLRRLGYVDDTYNTDMSEAIDNFAAATKNRYALSELGMDILAHSSVYTKKAMLHTALTSAKVPGQWQVGPKDAALRVFLSAHGYIPSVGCSKDEAWEGMKKYSHAHRIPACKTYNMLVSRILSTLNDHPLKRSG